MINLSRTIREAGSSLTYLYALRYLLGGMAQPLLSVVVLEAILVGTIFIWFGDGRKDIN